MSNSNGLSEADFDLLAKVTIVIYTYNRHPSFALRIASHWQETGARILVLHNGPREWGHEDISRLVPNQSYHFSKHGYAQQMVEVAAMLTTRYAVRMDDDNMLLPYAVADSIRDLERRTELVGSTPKAAVFGNSRGAYQFARAYEENDGFSNEHVDPRVRVGEVLVPYHVVGWYAVQRSYAFGRISNLIADVMNLSSCPYASEVAAEVGYAWIGPSTTSAKIGIFRSLENPPVESNHSHRSLTFTKWWTASDYGSEVAGFLDTLQEHLLLNDTDLDVIARGLDAMVYSRPEIQASGLHRAAKIMLPNFVWEGLQAARRRMRTRKMWLDARLSQEVNELLTTPGFGDLKLAIERSFAK